MAPCSSSQSASPSRLSRLLWSTVPTCRPNPRVSGARFQTGRVPSLKTSSLERESWVSGPAFRRSLCKGEDRDVFALCWKAAGELLRVVGPQFLEGINAAVDPGALPWIAGLCQDVVKQELHVQHGRIRAHRPKDWDEGVSLRAVALRLYLCQDVDRRDVHAEGGRLSLFGQAEVKDLRPAGCAVQRSCMGFASTGL